MYLEIVKERMFIFYHIFETYTKARMAESSGVQISGHVYKSTVPNPEVPSPIVNKPKAKFESFIANQETIKLKYILI